MPRSCDPTPEPGTLFTNEDNVTPNADEAAHDSNPELLPPSQLEEDPPPRPAHPRQPYEALTLIFGALVILAAAAFSFMIGSRIGWLRSAQPALHELNHCAKPSAGATAPAVSSPADSSAPSRTKDSANPDRAPSDGSSHPAASSAKTKAPTSSDELVVYDNDKVVFRMKPTPAEKQESSTPAAKTAQTAAAKSARTPHGLARARAGGKPPR